ncbi:dbp-1 [Sucra jujuba nucleopolyhedrovirus]|uniref:Dbp-1 n=1 Tax=Sucra jujuba nucleopolyhedrovirus TaxID=1563660 RepID=A0A097P8Z4_9ABAC|nr:dbp-1 [Sucra jujuba nucleopolyhedrovirus]AIU41269.1 dbp-1 [Sucra jujuba nucleopolyhedrovirus]
MAAKRKLNFDDDDQSKQMAVYNDDAAVEISELDTTANDDDSADDENMLCLFEPRTKRVCNKTWLDEFRYNLKRGNPTVVYCDTPHNDLTNILMSLKSYLNWDEYKQKLYPNVDKNISIEKARPPRTVNQIGWCVRGGLMQFYFCDEVTMQLCNGKHGYFIKAHWSEMSKHNQIMADCIVRYNNWQGQMVKMQDSVLINVPASKESSFVRQFYDVTRARNEKVYEHGIKATQTQVVCDMFTSQRFYEIFPFDNKPDASKMSEPVKMIMYAVLEGFKVGKEQEYETINNQKITEKVYSVSIQPICFFHVEL